MNVRSNWHSSKTLWGVILGGNSFSGSGRLRCSVDSVDKSRVCRVVCVAVGLAVRGTKTWTRRARRYIMTSTETDAFSIIAQSEDEEKGGNGKRSTTDFYNSLETSHRNTKCVVVAIGDHSEVDIDQMCKWSTKKKRNKKPPSRYESCWKVSSLEVDRFVFPFPSPPSLA